MCTTSYLCTQNALHYTDSLDFPCHGRSFKNDLFQRSSQVVLVGSSFLKFHPFSCIAQAVLGCPSPSPHNDSGLRMLGACSYGLIGITIGSCSRCLPLAVALSVYLGLLLLLSPPFLIAPCHLALRYPSGSIDFDFFYNRRVKQNTLFELCC